MHSPIHTTDPAWLAPVVAVLLLAVCAVYALGGAL